MEAWWDAASEVLLGVQLVEKAWGWGTEKAATIVMARTMEMLMAEMTLSAVRRVGRKW